MIWKKIEDFKMCLQLDCDFELNDEEPQWNDVLLQKQ